MKCAKHKTYKAKRKPTADCYHCRQMFEGKRTYKVTWSTERGSLSCTTTVSATSKEHAAEQVYAEFGDICIERIM